MILRYSKTSYMFLAIFFSLAVDIGEANPAFAALDSFNKDTLSNCKNSSLSGKKLMNLLHAIIARGDLTDIAFIQRTFDTKFEIGYGWNDDGSPNHQTLEYSAKFVLGEPLQVNVVVWSKIPRLRNNSIALMWIDSSINSQPNDDFLSSCLKIPASSFSSYFGGAFFTIIGRAGVSADIGSTQQDGSPGINGSKLYINFGYSSDNNFVNHIDITQRP